MQEKVVFDTSVYIGVFSNGLFQDQINGFNKIMYLAHPVLHELWIGTKGKEGINHLIRFGARFINLQRLVVPAPSTQILIGKACQKLRSSGELDASYPRIYNDVSIALIARQIGATVVTRNISDFEKIHKVVDFRFRDVIV